MDKEIIETGIETVQEGNRFEDLSNFSNLKQHQSQIQKYGKH
jgi:hypothetical protein